MYNFEATTILERKSGSKRTANNCSINNFTLEQSYFDIGADHEASYES